MPHAAMEVTMADSASTDKKITARRMLAGAGKGVVSTTQGAGDNVEGRGRTPPEVGGGAGGGS